MSLIVPDHLYEIEYHYQCGVDRREHVYTERADDQGFVLVHDPSKREQWLARYARTCAEDYLARVYARAGEWLVHVYRILEDERRHVVSIRMHWAGHEDSYR